MPPLLSTPSAAAAAPSIIRASTDAARWVAQSSRVSAAAASFSTTASRPKFSKARRDFRAWEKAEGRVYRVGTPGQPVYLATRGGNETSKTYPFPLNPQFKSTPVLDEKARELVWEKIMRDGEPIKAVSAELGIDIRRVAAIVRLKEVEKDWIAKVSSSALFPLFPFGSYMMISTHQFDKS